MRRGRALTDGAGRPRSLFLSMPAQPGRPICKLARSPAGAQPGEIIRGGAPQFAQRARGNRQPTGVVAGVRECLPTTRLAPCWIRSFPPVGELVPRVGHRSPFALQPDLPAPHRRGFFHNRGRRQRPFHILEQRLDVAASKIFSNLLKRLASPGGFEPPVTAAVRGGVLGSRRWGPWVWSGPGSLT